ncbi:MAG: potassium channel protein [Desulfobacterales bacterium]|jgi:voltage-gated potassium channel
MNSTKHLIISILLAAAIMMIGTVGYMLIEGWDFIDALYMTVITISTVGYGEVRTVDFPGRLFTIFLVLIGVGFTLYVAGAVVQFMVEGRMRVILGRRRLNRKIDKLKNHYIVCGYGRIGRVLCNRLRTRISDLVVVDANPDMIPAMEADGVLYISGDASDEQVLTKAGIHKAKGLIAVLGSDTENVFLVLTARQLNPELIITARSSQEASKSKLFAAGADAVESPNEIGALSMAHRIMRPTVTSFLDFAFAQKREDIQMEEIPVGPDSEMANIMLKDSGIRQRFNLILIAIKEPDGTMVFNPSFESIIRPGATVIAVGEVNNLKQLEAILNPSGA